MIIQFSVILKKKIQLSTFNIIFGYNIIGYMEDFSTINIHTKYKNYVYRRELFIFKNCQKL